MTATPNTRAQLTAEEWGRRWDMEMECSYDRLPKWWWTAERDIRRRSYVDAQMARQAATEMHPGED